MEQKTSLLVYNQLPEFVREEHPNFILFLEAYYEFLEKERYTNGVSQNNNLIEKLKELRNFSDVDYTLEQFEDQFFKTFASTFPKETKVSKEFLIKNILPLYRSKGTIKSFEYLFKILFDEDVQIDYPKQQVLRASDGKWVVENVLRVENSFYTEYESDGIKKEFFLPYVIDPSDITIDINNIKVENFYVRKEQKKIVFNFTPPPNAKIKISYSLNFDTTIFKNCKIVGVNSGAYSIIEKTGRRLFAGSNFVQFFVESKNTFGKFLNGELLKLDMMTENGIIPFLFQTLSEVQNIEIQKSGRDYNVGDILNFRGFSSKPALGVVDKVSSGFLETIKVRLGNFGAGYKVGNNVFPTNVTTNNFLSFIDTVDDSGTITPNTIIYNTDKIENFLDKNISDLDYGFNTQLSNLESVISQSINYITVNNLGPAINVIVSFSDLKPNEEPIFAANSSIIVDDVRISDLNSIGTIKVVTGGIGYKVGDNIKFINTFYFSGQGAKAEVSQVTSSGRILRVKVLDGGYNYSKQFLPLLEIESATGSGASLSVEHFMGQDALFDYEQDDGIPGKITSVKLLSKGNAYTTQPLIVVSSASGFGSELTAETTPSFVELPGRWITSDGMLSSDDIKLQGSDYYVDYSYVITSKVEFQKYKKIVSDLMNPSGIINYARYSIVDSINVNLDLDIDSTFRRNLVGTVNVSSDSVDVIGTGTFFNDALENGILTQGTYIIINSELMVVNSIINNTQLTVTESFNFNANNEIVSIMGEYDTVLTEDLIESEIEGGSGLFITTEDVRD
jgi:hypothetical protein